MEGDDGYRMIPINASGCDGQWFSMDTAFFEKAEERINRELDKLCAVMIATGKPCDTCKRKMHKSPIKLDKWYCANCKKYKD